MTAAAALGARNNPRHGGALKLHRGATPGEDSLPTGQPQSRANPPVRQCGTALAISYLIIGGAAHLPRSTGRGGARNRADRESHALTTKHVADLIAAERHSRWLGLPFTRMVTIHWGAAGVPLERMRAATGRFLDLLTRWLARRGCRTAIAWVHEGGEAKGGHAHILAHVPAAHVAALPAAQKRWLRAITGRPYRAGVIRSDPVGGRLGLEGSNPDLHLVNVQAALGYLLKGACPKAASKYHLGRLEPGGLVIGKRCGTSQNIGPTARKKGDA